MYAPEQILTTSHLGSPDLWEHFPHFALRRSQSVRETPNTTLIYVTGTNMPPISRILLLI